MPRLINWAMVLEDDASGLRAPETLRFCLTGRVYGDGRFDDGRNVVTTPILESGSFFKRLKEGIRVATTVKGTEYHLGFPKLEWVEWLEQEGWPSAKVMRAMLPRFIILPKSFRMTTSGPKFRLGEQG